MLSNQTIKYLSLTFCNIKLNSYDWQCYINRNLLGYSQFTNWPKEKEKEQKLKTMIYKTLHRKLNIKQHEPR